MFEFLLGLTAGAVLVLLGLVLALFRLGAHAPPSLEERRAAGGATRRMRTESALVGARPDASFEVPEYLEHYADGSDSETCAWLDILAHRAFRAFLHEAQHLKFEEIINERLRSLKIPQFVGPIELQDINFGTVAPVVQDIKVLSWRDQRPVIMELHLSYKGDAHVSIDTTMFLNVRQKSLATLPIEVAISDIALDATLQVNLYTSLSRPVVSVSFVEEPFVDFKVHSEIGASMTLKDLPHLKNILLNAVIRSCRLLPNAYTLELGGLSLDELGEAASIKPAAAKKQD